MFTTLLALISLFMSVTAAAAYTVEWQKVSANAGCLSFRSSGGGSVYAAASSVSIPSATFLCGEVGAQDISSAVVSPSSMCQAYNTFPTTVSCPASAQSFSQDCSVAVDGTAQKLNVVPPLLVCNVPVGPPPPRPQPGVASDNRTEPPTSHGSAISMSEVGALVGVLAGIPLIGVAAFCAWHCCCRGNAPDEPNATPPYGIPLDELGPIGSVVSGVLVRSHNGSFQSCFRVTQDPYGVGAYRHPQGGSIAFAQVLSFAGDSAVEAGSRRPSRANNEESQDVSEMCLNSTGDRRVSFASDLIRIGISQSLPSLNVPVGSSPRHAMMARFNSATSFSPLNAQPLLFLSFSEASLNSDADCGCQLPSF